MLCNMLTIALLFFDSEGFSIFNHRQSAFGNLKKAKNFLAPSNERRNISIFKPKNYFYIPSERERTMNENYDLNKRSYK